MRTQDGECKVLKSMTRSNGDLWSARSKNVNCQSQNISIQ